MVARSARSAERHCGSFALNLKKSQTLRELFSARVANIHTWKRRIQRKEPQITAALPLSEATVATIAAASASCRHC